MTRNLLLLITIIGGIAHARQPPQAQTPPPTDPPDLHTTMYTSSEVLQASSANTMQGAHPITLSTPPANKPMQLFGPPPGSVGIQDDASHYPARASFEVGAGAFQFKHAASTTPSHPPHQQSVYTSQNLNKSDPDYMQQLLDVFWQLKRNSPPPAATQPIAAPESATPVSGFVKRDGWRFTLDGAPFFAAGTNAYGIACQQEAWTEDQIISTLNFHAQRGVTVLRIWAFADGYGEYEQWKRPFPFQATPGQYIEANIQRLDFVLHYGARVGLRFTLALVNSWPDFGGRLWYVRSLIGPQASEDEFYTSQATRDAYKQWMTYLLNRVNVYNGLRYADDPAIFSFNLCNEPTTAPGYDASLGWAPGTAIKQWVEEMAAHFKSIDTNHLLSVGDEGYRTDSRGEIPAGWVNDGYKGVDARAHIANPNIDYQTLHFYGESFSIAMWNWTGFFTYYAANRANMARGYNKPIVLEEIGILSDSLPMGRNAFLSYAFDAANYAGYGGVLVWQAVPDGGVLQSGLDFTYSQDGGQAVQAQLNWANAANTGQNPSVAFSPDPPCVDYPPPGSSDAGACMIQAPTPQQCWPFLGGFCRNWCDSCKYFKRLRKFSPYWQGDDLPLTGPNTAPTGDSQLIDPKTQGQDVPLTAPDTVPNDVAQVADVVCDDTPPVGIYNNVTDACPQLAAWGACDATFMQGACAASCKRCA